MVFRRILLNLVWKEKPSIGYSAFPSSTGLTGFQYRSWGVWIGCSRSLVWLKLDNFALTIMLLAMFMPNFLLTTGGVLSCAYAFVISIMDLSILPPIREGAGKKVWPFHWEFCRFWFSIFWISALVCSADFSILSRFEVFYASSPDLYFCPNTSFLKITQVNVFIWTVGRANSLDSLYFFSTSGFWSAIYLDDARLCITLGLLYDFRRQKESCDLT